MKKNFLFLTILVFSLVTVYPVLADEAKEKKLAEELLNLMNIKQNQEKFFSQIKEMQAKQIEKYATNHPKEDVEKQQKMLDDGMALMVKEMSWDTMKGQYVQVYTEVFDEAELQGLVEFYQGPVGKKFLEKNPELTTKMMQVSQKKMDEVLPKLQAMSREAAPTPPATAAAPGKPAVPSKPAQSSKAK